MRCQFLCILLIITASFTILCRAQSPSLTRKVLALYFTNLSAGHSNIDSLSDEISSRIGTSLEILPSDIRLGSLTNLPSATGSFLPFSINGTKVNVTDSLVTSTSYIKYADLWRDALNKNLVAAKPLMLNGNEVIVDITRYETTHNEVNDRDTQVMVDDYIEGVDPDVISSTKRQELMEAISTREYVMQFRLKNINLEDYKKSLPDFMILIAGTRSIASNILDIPADNIVLYNIKPGSVLVQFTVHPATSSVYELNEKWTQAVANKRAELSTAFSDFDFDFPPVVPLFMKVPIEQGVKRSPSAAIIAGAVIGCLAGIAVVGGTAGFAYRRYQKKDKNAIGIQRQKQNFGEISPGGMVMSPNALSNVQVQGQATPNAHNYR